MAEFVLVAGGVCGLYGVRGGCSAVLGPLDECFGRLRSRGALWRGRAVKQMGKCVASFWSAGGNLAKSLTDCGLDVGE